jgi:sugar phosphate isomerase/epimerase
VDAAFSALEELSLFARQRGVEILLENIPNELSSAERLQLFLELTHLDLNFVLRRRPRQHGRRRGSRVRTDEAAHPLHARARQQRQGRQHLFPLAEGGTIDWKKTMELLRSAGGQYPLLLELKEVPEWPHRWTKRRGLRPAGKPL